MISPIPGFELLNSFTVLGSAISGAPFPGLQGPVWRLGPYLGTMVPLHVAWWSDVQPAPPILLVPQPPGIYSPMTIASMTAVPLPPEEFRKGATNLNFLTDTAGGRNSSWTWFAQSTSNDGRALSLLIKPLAVPAGNYTFGLLCRAGDRALPPIFVDMSMRS